MKRFTHLTLALGTIALLALLLFLAVGAQPAARADGPIKVPNDYPTIQAAIDAAEDGGTILVAAGAYTENLSITKSVDLSGGWDPSFNGHTTEASVIDGNAQGRVISVTCATSDTHVLIHGFTIQNGDASGLGAPVLPGFSVDLPFESEIPAATLTSDLLSPSEHAEQLRAHLGEVVARGQYPGGTDAYQAMLEQLDWRTDQAEQARARAQSSPVLPQNQPEQSAGVGGGVFSYNASLHLAKNIIQGNIANQYGIGVGGGVYAGHAPPGGVHIIDNIIVGNTASGGADGWGGGLYLFQTPGVLIEDNGFMDNVGSAGGYDTHGQGGGLGVDSSPNAVVRDNVIERNTANTAWDAHSGAGGGMYLFQSSDAQLRDNVFGSNLAGLRNHGNGGALFVVQSDNVLMTDNTIEKNWAAMFGEESMNGGGALLFRANNAIFTGNRVNDNTACVYVRGVIFDNCAGGGLLVGVSNNPQVTDNIISGNVANLTHYGSGKSGVASGGGGYIQITYGTVVSGNTFVDNVASLSDIPGSGGGLYVDGTRYSHVRDNLFQENRGGTDGGGNGGALILDGWQNYPHLNTTVEGNLFLHNQASANLDPASGSSGGACQDTLTIGSSFINNVVAGNMAAEGGGIVLNATQQGQLINNTLVDNTDSGVIVSGNSPIDLVNNIVVSHTVGISVTEGATATVRYTLWDDNDTNIGGSGTISHTHPVIGDPAFVAPSEHDYHLTIASAARDTGDPAGVPPAPDLDRDGVARPQGMAVDIGAYEWQGYYQYLPLVTKSLYLRTGWAIGSHETGGIGIVHTSDSGQTWEAQGDPAVLQNLDPGDISAVDAQTAWAAGLSNAEQVNGVILKTTNGGTTWVTQTIPVSVTAGIKGIKGLSRDEAWAASLDGVILHTTDGGENWAIVPHPTVSITQVNRIDAMGTDVWIADASNTGSVVHSTDSGASWRVEPLPGQDSALTVNAFSPTAVWATGSLLQHNPTFYRTKNGGDQWDKVKTIGAGDHLDDVCAADADNAWGAQNGDESDGRIWRVHVTPDGTPEAQDVTPTELDGYPPGGVTCLDTQVAWVAATVSIPHLPDPSAPRGYILHTTDGGESWVRQAAPTDIKYWKISFVGAQR